MPHLCELLLAEALADERAGVPPLPEGNPEGVRRFARENEVHK
jgi:hypothetical protein